MKVKTSIIVALAENRCIGIDNKMPWHISDDLKRFKTLTTGHAVIMGRKTFESIIGYLGKPLPDRDSIIISRSNCKNNFNIPVFDNVEKAISHAKEIAIKNRQDEVFIIGGAQIYTQIIDATDRLHLTKVHESIDGDAFFPEFNKYDWQETEREDNLDHNPQYSFITLDRKYKY